MTTSGTVVFTQQVPTAKAQLEPKVRRAYLQIKLKLLTICLVEYDETIDFDLNKLFSGGINASALPMAKVDGKCQPLYPHARVRVNTLFELAVTAGKITAYCDKHPAYDLVSDFTSRPKT
jgi:hypothetical protein